MKAIICEKYSSFKDLKIKDINIPSINKNQVLIRVFSSTVASGDCVVRNAVNPLVRIFFGIRRPRNPILGTDLAGIIEQIGTNVTDFKVGDRVIASTGMKFGCHAEFIGLNQSTAITRIPDTLSFIEATTLSFGGLAGLHYLRKMEKRKHSRLLIYGASGAVGTSSIQLAKYFGFEVTAVCSSGNIELVRSLGADFTVDYTVDNWKKNLPRFDYIFDAVGKTKKSDWIDYIKNSSGFYTIAKGLVRENKKDLELLVQYSNSGELKPVIDRIYSMKQIVEAYEYVETGRKRGNVVLDFSVE